ncbi:hypothetical protein BKA70DRAFT_1516948 [Coprinopsis sp. MPI-PUGE-AT-0042]|nr:hypothetical protein BKA70DRAFT_1516948 [Coprinopsis sp. MPI-PUGE-AT-0042]
MGASFSTWARWDDAVVQQVLASKAPPIQSPGPALIHGAQHLTINGGTFIQNNQQASAPQDPKYLRKVLDFLSAVNFRTIQQENLGKWMPGTIKWLLESSMFQFWLDTQCAILWGTGMPGAGKTILASVVIKYLEALAKASSDICVAFVYCRYTEPMKVRDILAALVRQLLSDSLIYYWTEPTQEDLIDAIQKILRCFRIAYLFIDGLDEALYDEQFDLLDTLKSVPANFFITSRPLVRLKDVLPNAKFFDIAAQEEDIKLLVAQHIDRNPDLRQVLEGDEQRERVIKKICETSQGMFLHASLMVEAVRYCTNPRHVMEQLDKLPSKLDVLYDEAFKRIEEQPEQRVALTKRLLLWIAFAFIPLTVDDLQYAVASNPKVDWKTAENLIPESLLVSVCCGLITIEGDYKRIVRLVHYTALDAVKRIMPRWETSPDCLLTEACVERLIDCNIPSSSHYGHQPPLLNYALKAWCFHAKESVRCPAQPDARPTIAILQFLAMFKVFPTGFDEWRRDNPTAPVHLIVYYHLPYLLPLTTCHNNVEMVELLLKLDGIDVNLQDEDGNTALMLAAGGGRVGTVKSLLFDPRVDTNKRNAKGRTALHCALNNGADSGHTEAALHLIATPGVDINAADYCGWTPLMVAHNHPPRLHDHLAQHPDIDLLKKDKDGQTPLMHACRWGTSSAVRWYLRLPGVDARDLSGASALAHRARHKSRVAEVEDYLSDFLLLIDAGLGINEQDARGFTALMHAVQGSFLGATQALLQLENVDVNLENRGRKDLAYGCLRCSSEG